MGSRLSKIVLLFEKKMIDEPVKLSSYFETVVRNEKLQLAYSKALQASQRVTNVLVMGYPRSGKTLFLMNFKSTFENCEVVWTTPSKVEPPRVSSAMREATLSSARILADVILSAGVENELEAARFIADQPRGCALTPEIAKAIRRLWRYGGDALVTAKEKCSNYIADNLDYLVGRLQKLISHNFTPNNTDIMSVYVPTARPERVLLKEKLLVNRKSFPVAVAELPGSMLQNSDALNCILDCVRESAETLVFTVSLADYDAVSYSVEAGSWQPSPPKNRLLEALDIWTSVANSPLYANTEIVLLLTKADVFKKKIQYEDLRYVGSKDSPPRFLDYKGGRDFGCALSFIESLFFEKSCERKVPVRIHALNLLDSAALAFCVALKDHIYSLHEDRLLAIEKSETAEI